MNRMVLTKALHADGHTTVAAEHGLEALEILDCAGDPGVDVVLLDERVRHGGRLTPT